MLRWIKKFSARIRQGILFAKQSDTMIIGVHSDTSFSAFSAVRALTLPEKKWKKKIRELIQVAKKIR